MCDRIRNKHFRSGFGFNGFRSNNFMDGFRNRLSLFGEFDNYSEYSHHRRHDSDDFGDLFKFGGLFLNIGINDDDDCRGFGEEAPPPPEEIARESYKQGYNDAYRSIMQRMHDSRPSCGSPYPPSQGQGQPRQYAPVNPQRAQVPIGRTLPPTSPGVGVPQERAQVPTDSAAKINPSTPAKPAVANQKEQNAALDLKFSKEEVDAILKQSFNDLNQIDHRTDGTIAISTENKLTQELDKIKNLDGNDRLDAKEEASYRLLQKRLGEEKTNDLFKHNPTEAKSLLNKIHSENFAGLTAPATTTASATITASTTTTIPTTSTASATTTIATTTTAATKTTDSSPNEAQQFDNWTGSLVLKEAQIRNEAEEKVKKFAEEHSSASENDLRNQYVAKVTAEVEQQISAFKPFSFRSKEYDSAIQEGKATGDYSKAGKIYAGLTEKLAQEEIKNLKATEPNSQNSSSNNSLTFDEFKQLIKKEDPNITISDESLKTAFNILNSNGGQTIDAKELACLYSNMDGLDDVRDGKINWQGAKSATSVLFNPDKTEPMIKKYRTLYNSFYK